MLELVMDLIKIEQLINVVINVYIVGKDLKRCLSKHQKLINLLIH